ncbi:hypothetical protein Gotri_000126 [Gossypium trilobum]|uniref:Zinc finger LSD1-type domain-containing protein n=1 Tax=Gossypium trilobum TaxID=34281 RepID=A0A7J9FMJ0_9ROSI|nr:hypothetical protein [Gossypium trilobum]
MQRWLKWLKWFVALVVNCFHILKELGKLNVHVVKQSTLYLKSTLTLSAHQVGLVRCDSCALLLMYPYGSPSVKCSSCLSVTEIGEHNRRPPWSVQQGQPTPPNSVH